MKLDEIKSVFIVGIKGVAMSNIAVILKKLGKKVAGSDTSENYITSDVLTQNSIPVHIGFDVSHIPSDCNLLLFAASHGGENNPQVKYAKENNISVFHQAELLSLLFDSGKTKVAVCGCHGKTTTSSLLAYALLKLGKNPSYLVGAPKFTDFNGSDYLGTDYFILEADEYGVSPPNNVTPKMQFLNPDYILCTNIDFDHPDVYKNIEHVKQVFTTFFNDKVVFICFDDINSKEISYKIKQNKLRTYGFSTGSTLQISNPVYRETSSSFSLKLNSHDLGDFSIGLFGEKNILNTAGAIYVLLELGFSPNDIKKAIINFTGAERRFELLGQLKDNLIFDDYGHHPHEIEATIDAARKRFPQRRIGVLFQPHTFSRTASLKEEFIAALKKADYSLVLPIFASARENPTEFSITSQALSKDNVYGFDSTSQALLKLQELVEPKDIIITMGAGSVYKLKNDIIKTLKSV